MAKGRGRSGDYARLEALLADEGMTMPPMPSIAETRLKERAEWCFSTRGFKESPEDLRHFVRKAVARVSPDYVLVARVEQGTSACTMYYFFVQGPLQVFLEMVGGGPTGRERSAATVNECFAWAHELAAAVPQAIRAGRLSRAGRLTVVGSDRVGSFWEVAAADERASQPGRPTRPRTRDVRTPRQILEEAVTWCRGVRPLT